MKTSHGTPSDSPRRCGGSPSFRPSSSSASSWRALAFEAGTGVGVTGINHPVGWGVFIVTFVFWIGIGHAGTLISAILFLFNQTWRTAINRSAEAMTIFAVMVAGIFP